MYDLKDSDFFDMDADAFDTVIEDDISFTGNVKVKQPFFIRGKIKGYIESESDVVVDDIAIIEADIVADRVLVKGRVKGNVRGNQLVFVAASGTVIGDITSHKVVLEPGSEFTGKCTMVK